MKEKPKSSKYSTNHSTVINKKSKSIKEKNENDEDDDILRKTMHIKTATSFSKPKGYYTSTRNTAEI